VTLVICAGCYSPSYRDCEVTCAGNVCPSGLMCENGMCRVPGAAGLPCGSLDDARTDDTMVVDDAPSDAPAVVNWPAPQLLLTVPNSARSPTMPSDGLTLYFSLVPSTIGKAIRGSASGPFTLTTSPPNLETSQVEDGPDVSADHQSLFFIRNSLSGRDINIATYDAAQNTWTAGSPPPDLDSVGYNSGNPSITPDKLMCAFDNINDQLATGLYIATRPTLVQQWEPAVRLSQLADANVALSPALSADKLTLYYAKPVNGKLDIFEIRRASPTATFSGAGTPLSSTINTAVDETDPFISSDGKTLLFARANGNRFEIWGSTRP
jgi:hypothetical protein